MIKRSAAPRSDSVTLARPRPTAAAAMLLFGLLSLPLLALSIIQFLI